MRLLALLVVGSVVASALGGCGSSGVGGDVSPTCLDASGNPTSTCAVTPKGDICDKGDATSCVNLTKVEVQAGSGKDGACLHLIFENDCSSEIFADTCIEMKGGDFPEQCWTSSVLEGFTIDVSACNATGKYFQVATTSSGALEPDEQACKAPK
jgi:hypothetical protein